MIELLLCEDLLNAVKHYDTTPHMILALIKFGANVDKALLLAARYNSNPEVIKAMLEAGADVNTKSDGITALMWAAKENSNPEVIKFLINSGAYVNALRTKKIPKQ